MEWSSIWSWTWSAVQWCFWGLMFYGLLRWWLRTVQDSVKLRFVETKIDALLERLEVDFDEPLREHIAKTLRDEGESAAMKHYMLHSGNSLEEAEEYVRDLSAAEEPQPDSPFAPPDKIELGELQEIAEQLLRRSRRKSRRKR